MGGVQKNNGQPDGRERYQFTIRTLLFCVVVVAVLVSVVVNFPEWIPLAIAICVSVVIRFVLPESESRNRTSWVRLAFERVVAALAGLVNGAVIGVFVALPLSNVPGVGFNFWYAVCSGAILGLVIGALFPKFFSRLLILLP